MSFYVIEVNGDKLEPAQDTLFDDDDNKPHTTDDNNSGKSLNSCHFKLCLCANEKAIKCDDVNYAHQYN